MSEILDSVMFAGMKENLDGLVITNKEGIIEFSVALIIGEDSMQEEEAIGRSILEVYPELTEETSSHFRVMRTGEAIINERQTLTDTDGKTMTFISSTYPMRHRDEIIGAMEWTTALIIDGREYKPGGWKRGIDWDPSRRKEQGETLYCLDDMVSQSEEMREIKEKVRRVAISDASVLVLGETGTGKELIAQGLHTHGRRRRGPFVSQNCAAIPEALLESTLFGTVRGGYTGAEDRKGLFELAEGGTLFLDEINSMDMGLQSKILKAIEEKKIRRVGSEREQPIDVRIVSAMNQEPEAVIASNLLRRDLFYRLNVIQIKLPLLKDRKGDIPLITEHYIEKYNAKYNRHVMGVSEIVEKLFNDYSWPGNVRELRNAIEHAFNMTRGSVIKATDIPDYIVRAVEMLAIRPAIPQNAQMSDASEHLSLTELVSNYERELIRRTLVDSKSVTEAASRLKISRQALNYKVMKYGLGK